MNESTYSGDEWDPGLEALFAKEHGQIAEEPFVSRAVKRAAADHKLTRRIRRLTALAALIAVVGASPWLIEVSVIVSTALDTSFATVSNWLSTPIGASAGLVIGALAAAAFRSRLRR